MLSDEELADISFFKNLTQTQKDKVAQSAFARSYKSGYSIAKSVNECTGLILVKNGAIRVFTVSNKGKEITLYRLFEGDTCILSASCVLNNIDFEVSLAIEKDCEMLVIPTGIFDELTKTNIEVSRYVSNLMANRLSDVMWVLQQYVFNGTASRIADFLLINSKNNVVEITHEQLANETGTAREVVTRLLKKMQDDGVITFSRGKIEIIDKTALL